PLGSSGLFGSSGSSGSPEASPLGEPVGDCVGVPVVGVPVGDCEDGGADGVSDGAPVGSWLVGSWLGVCAGVGDDVGPRAGRKAAPWSVSRSNPVTSSMTPKVYAAQISAGKPPPLTRGRPAALYILTCGCGGSSSSPNSPTEVTRSGVKPVNQAEMLSSEVP